MMMIFDRSNTLVVLALFVLYTVASCSGPKTDSSGTVATESDVEVETEDENPPEDKSKRPSPPAVTKASIGDLSVTIDYSSPAVKGRPLWGGLVPNGEIWRTGANEATVFEVSQNVVINGEELAAGKYGLFTIPGEGEWTVIFNTVWDQWGAFNYEDGKDALRITVPTNEEVEAKEGLEFQVDDQGQVQWKKIT